MGPSFRQGRGWVLPGAFAAIVAIAGNYDLGFYVAAAPTLITGIILLRRTKLPR